MPPTKTGSAAARNSAAYERLSTIREEDVLRIHEKAGQGRHRGIGVRDPRRLRALVEDLRRAAIQRTELAAMIAHVFDDIEHDPQPFVDCNHRTAMLLGRFLAHEFGFNLRYSGPEGERLREEWENLSRKELEGWVREHLVPLKGS